MRSYSGGVEDRRQQHPVGQGLRESHADGEHDPEAAVVHRTLGKQRESAKSRQRDQHFRQQDRLVAGSGALP